MEQQPQPDTRSIEEVLGREEAMEFKRAFAFSFRFSQGNEGARYHQQLLFQAIKILRPIWKAVPENEGTLQELNDFTIHMLDKLKESGRHTYRIMEQGEESTTRATQFFHILHSPIDRSDPTEKKGFPRKLIKLLRARTIDADYKYLVEKDGETPDEEGFVEDGRPIDNPNADPWSSQLVDYIIREQQTGSKVYDEIFAMLADYLWPPQVGVAEGDHFPYGKFQEQMPKKYKKAQAVIQAYNNKEEHIDAGVFAVLPDTTKPETLLLRHSA